MLPALRDAWATVVPDMKDRHGPLPPLMLVLTVVTGLVDAFSYLLLGHVFVANMTGNVVFLGFATAGAAGFSLAASLVALAAFTGGALLGGRIVRCGHAHRGRMVYLTLLLETALVAAAYGVTLVAGVPYGHDARYALIALLALGMGAQNAGARALAVPDLTTTVLTLTITGTAADSRLAGGTDSRIGRRALSALSMFLGALIGALAVLHGQPALPLLVAALLLASGSAAAFRLSRSQGTWTDPL
ncbi:YoaK family protein [Streptomyces sp. NPDC020096]